MDGKLTAIDSNALPWEERPNEKIGRSLFRKNRTVDEDTGMEVRLAPLSGRRNQPAAHPSVRSWHVCLRRDPRYP